MVAMVESELKHGSSGRYTMHRRNNVVLLVMGCLLSFCWTSSSRMAFGQNPSGLKLYGAAVEGDTLGNLPLSPKSYGGRIVSFRFRATNSGQVTSVTFYNVHRLPGGYGKGTGGKILIELRTDDGTSNHWPSKTILAWCVLDRPMSVGNFPVLKFDKQPYLETGKLYHLVFSNIDSNPTQNYVSVNCLHNFRRVAIHVNVGINGKDMAVLVRNDKFDIWRQRYESTPIFNLFFSDGRALGQGYVGALSEQNVTMNSTNQVRETFLVKGSAAAVSEVSVRVSREWGDLNVRLESDDGTLIEEGVVPGVDIVPEQSLFPKNKVYSYIRKMRWYSYRFRSVRGLELDKRYNLVLYSANGSYVTFGLLKGKRYTFSSKTHFDDGWAQYSTDNGRTWQDYVCYGRHTKDVDLQFYFNLVNVPHSLDHS